MPQTIYYLPDPQTQMLNNIMRTLQINRFKRQEREHFEGIEDEAKDKRMTAIVASAVIGGVAGFASAPVGVASDAITGAALTSTGALVPSALGSTLSGAFIGSQVGSRIASGDIAGAIGTAAGGIQQGLKSRDELNAFGFNPTDADRRALAKLATDQGKLPSQVIQDAKNAGLTVPQQLQQVQTNAQSAEQIADLAKSNKVTDDYFMEVADQFGGNLQAAQDFIQEGQRNIEVQQRRAIADSRAESEYESNRRQLVQNKDMEVRFTEEQKKRFLNLQGQKNDLVRLRDNGELATDQYPIELGKINKQITALLKEKDLQPRNTPFKESVNQQVVTVPLIRSDGTVAGDQMYSMNEKGVPRPVHFVPSNSEDVAKEILRHQANLSKGGLSPVSIQKAANDYMEAKKIEEQIRNGTFTGNRDNTNNTTQQAPVTQQVPTAQATQQQPAGASTGFAGRGGNFPQPKQQEQKVLGAQMFITSAISSAPDIEKWNPAMFEQTVPHANLLIEFFTQKLKAGGKLSEAEINMSKIARRIIAGS